MILNGPRKFSTVLRATERKHNTMVKQGKPKRAMPPKSTIGNNAKQEGDRAMTVKQPTEKQKEQLKKATTDKQADEPGSPGTLTGNTASSSPTNRDNRATGTPGTSTPPNPVPPSMDLILSRLTAISTSIEGINDNISQLRHSLDYNQTEITDIKRRLDGIEAKQTQIERNSDHIEMLKRENAHLKQRLEQYEVYSRRDNLIISGLSETENEVPDTVAQNFFKMLLKDESLHIPISRCHRLGRKTAGGGARSTHRPLIVRFQTTGDRNRIWNTRRELKGTNIWIKEDFPAATEANRKRLYPILREAKVQGKKASLIADKLIVEGQSYTVNDLYRLPGNLRPDKAAVRHTNRYVMFYGRTAVYSNFHPRKVTIENREYNCVEQAFQHKKALDANDTNAATKILATHDPAEQKRIGDKVKVSKKWEQRHGVALMKKAVLAKFSQHEDLKGELKSTQGKCLVECNPYDKFWSCGMKLEDPNACNPSNWTGENQLGMCLDETRRALQ